MKPRYVVGMGTGRTGSMSFAEFMNNQKHTTFTHEKMDVTMHPLFYSYQRAMKQLRGYGGKWRGDVSPGWCAWAPSLVRNHPDAKVVWLHRDKDEVVESFIAQKEQKPEWFTSFDGPNGYLGAYPVQELEYSRDAVARCIDRTYWLCQSFHTLHPNHCYVVDMNYMNDEDIQVDLLKWLGYKEKHMVLGMPHKNARTNLAKEPSLKDIDPVWWPDNPNKVE